MQVGLPLPPFFDPRNAESWAYSPDQQKLFAAAALWRRQHALRPAASDAATVHLLLIDVQKDFCFPQGSLFVGGHSGRGALDDNRRTAEFIYRNLGRITRTTCTMDSHLPFQIFFPSFWVDREGAALWPHRTIDAAQVRSGEARVNPALGWLGDAEELRRHALHYCAELERRGKYRLYLWPPHCIVGSDGHALAGVVHEARMFHAYARNAQAAVELKGDHPLTENYSVLAPEVLTRHDGTELARRNSALVETLLRADAVIVAGQAASHCVKSSLEDLLGEIRRRDPQLARKVYILVDCMSAVVAPGADFTPQAEEALARFAEAGMRLVSSTEPMESWLR
jgi:nicotinamidase-related amidase